MKLSIVEKLIKQDIKNLLDVLAENNINDTDNNENLIDASCIARTLIPTFKSTISYNIKENDDIINLWDDAEKDTDILEKISKYGKDKYLVAILLYLNSKNETLSTINNSNISYINEQLSADVNIIDTRLLNIETGCELDKNTIFINSDGDVYYNIESDIYDFNFTINGATIQDIKKQNETNDTSISGCTDTNAINYDSNASYDNESCLYSTSISGCMDSNAINYNSNADYNDDSCVYSVESYGNAIDSNFTLSHTINTVTGTSDGNYIDENCGRLLKLDLSGNPTTISDITFSDISGNDIDVKSFDNEKNINISSRNVLLKYKVDCNGSIKKSEWTIIYQSSNSDIKKEFLEACSSTWVSKVLELI